jgi:ribosome-associated heat shock protein Hsp15
MKRADPATSGTHDDRVRLDKWLWSARFYKTRSLAAQAVDAGQVRVNGDRVKPARALRAGEIVTVRKSAFVWEVQVLALSDRRGGAMDAAKLYRETAQSFETREALVAQRRAASAGTPQLSGRPTKRQRRKLEDFLGEP